MTTLNHNDFERLYNNRYLSNVVFTVENTNFYAHKVVLSLRSSYFKRLIELRSNSPNSTLEIELPEFKAAHFEKVLEFVYTGKTEITNDDYLPLYSASTLFRLPDLQWQCKEYMQRIMNTSCVFRIWKRAFGYKDTSMCNLCQSFVVEKLIKPHGLSTPEDETMENPVLLFHSLKDSIEKNGIVLPDEEEIEHVQSKIVRRRRMAQFEKKIVGGNGVMDLLQFIMKNTSDIVGSERYSFFVEDSENEELVSLLAVSEHVIRVPFGKGVVWSAYNSGKRKMVNNSKSSTVFYPDVDKILEFETRNVLAVPVKGSAGKIVGVFELVNKTAGNFTSVDSGFVAACMRLVGNVLIQRGRELEAERESLEAYLLHPRDSEDPSFVLEDYEMFQSEVPPEISSAKPVPVVMDNPQNNVTHVDFWDQSKPPLPARHLNQQPKVQQQQQQQHRQSQQQLQPQIPQMPRMPKLAQMPTPGNVPWYASRAGGRNRRRNFRNTQTQMLPFFELDQNRLGNSFSNFKLDGNKSKSGATSGAKNSFIPFVPPGKKQTREKRKKKESGHLYGAEENVVPRKRKRVTGGMSQMKFKKYQFQMVKFGGENERKGKRRKLKR